MTGDDQPIRIRGYRDFVLLGHGASSFVYRALQEEFDRHVAVKVLRADNPEDPARKRFAREKTTIGRLGGHPNIVQVFDADLTGDGRPYIAMQLYEESLADRLAAKGSLRADEAATMMASICDAVLVAHQAGILHRDIKPQNVLLSQWGPGLADFGIARATGNLEWSQTLREMTPLHAAPETFLDDRRPDERSDIWSLGSTLYTALAGRPPFFSAANESIWAYQVRLERDSLPPIARADVPHALVAVLSRALAKDPEDRFPDAGEMGAALRAAVGTAPTLPLGQPPGVGQETTVTRPEGPVDAAHAVGPVPVAGVAQADPALPAPAGDGNATIARPRPAEMPDQALDAGEAALEAMSPRSRLVVGVAAAAATVIVAVLLFVLVTNNGGAGQTPVRIPSSVPSATLVSDTAPTGFVADDHGEIVDLHWTDNSGGRARYAIAYRPVGGEQKTVVVESGTDYTISGLDPTVGYCFRLIAIGVDGQGRQTQAYADTSVRGCTPITPATTRP